MLHVGRPEDHWNRESEAQPKFVTKRGHRVAGVTVVTRERLRYLVVDMRIGRLRMSLMFHGSILSETSKKSNWFPDASFGTYTSTLQFMLTVGDYLDVVGKSEECGSSDPPNHVDGSP